MSAVITEQHTLKISRRFKASRERVFDAFASIDMLKLWLGPGDYIVIDGTVDFRPGGTYVLHNNAACTDGSGERTCSTVGGTYREIKRPEKLVFTWRKLSDDTMPETVVTVDFAAVGNETLLTLTQTGFDSGDLRDRHNFGWTGSFDQLDAVLAR